MLLDVIHLYHACRGYYLIVLPCYLYVLVIMLVIVVVCTCIVMQCTIYYLYGPCSPYGTRLAYGYVRLIKYHYYAYALYNVMLNVLMNSK